MTMSSGHKFSLKRKIVNRLLLLLFFCIAYGSLAAGVRSDQEMQTIAFDKLKAIKKSDSHRLLSANQLIRVADEKVYSVYESHDMGFVIVGKDTRLPKVLGYSKTLFNKENMPPAMTAWLGEVSEACTQNAISETLETAVEPIKPFITTRWGQSEPYNNLTPKVGTKSTPSGCVATAMAQIINYRQYPESVSFMGKYYVGDNDQTGKSEKVKSTYTYPYKLAYGEYVDSVGVTQTMEYTDDEATAIATLMRDCGYSAEMTYTPDFSGTNVFDAGTALISMFKYPATTVKVFSREYYSAEEWKDIIYTELENRSPILFVGLDKQFGGHAFVVAGNDEEGLLYVNWGWDGSSDGFYDITLMNPETYYFTSSNRIVTGIRTSNQLPCDKKIYQFGTEEPYTLKLLDSGDIELCFNNGIYNVGTYGTSYCMDVVAEDVETHEMTSLANLFENIKLQTLYGFGAFTDTLQVENPLSPGQYELFVGVKRNSDTQWTHVRTIGGEMHFNATVASDGKMTIDETPILAGIVAPKVQVSNGKMVNRFKGTYNLQGQKINTDYRGIVIKDGIKVLQK